MDTQLNYRDIIKVNGTDLPCWWALPTLRYIKGCGAPTMQIFSAIHL
ncbi:MAG: hypothetical protein RID09_13290 [Coleofasciculus sp. G1-WW12-02]